MSDDDIEFLDEDAEIVQQCVQLVHSQSAIKIEPEDDEEEEEPRAHVIQKPKLETSLLIERPSLMIERPAPSRKKKKEDDTDYDPMADSPYFYRKRRHNTSKGSVIRKYEIGRRSSQHSQSPPVRKAALPRTQVNRREMTIKIPDFDDPLCLPVRALVRDESDARRLKLWNQLCLDQFKNNDIPLRPRKGPVLSSKRTVVIRNLFNKYSGKTETTFWSKTTVEGAAGDSKSDVVQSVLPRYREKKILTAYKLGESRRRRAIDTRDRHEVLLTKEIYGDEEALVAYKPESNLAMVFKMFDSETVDVPEEDRRYLLEMASCAACVRCYQASWRARDQPVNDERTEATLSTCPTCARACGSAPALISHLRTHGASEVRRHRRAICDALAKLLPYHYCCRVCQQQFGSVRHLHRHLATHKGTGEFYCEIGDHTVS